MFYNSLNNKLNLKKFIDVFLKNISKDKNLYTPFDIKKKKKKFLLEMLDKDYCYLAFYILKIFIKEIPDNILYYIINNSYKNKKFIINFDYINNNNYYLNLNNGNTLSFKDIALKPLGILLNYISNFYNKKIIIFCSTSGDTGSSALNNFKKFNNMKLFIFHPFNFISEIQRKQMTTIISKNIYNISLLGNFDVSQNFIKKIFENINNINNYLIISVNSINWFRIILQIVYYSYISLKIYKNKLVNFYIPTGNFGNALSAIIAKKIGFPIGKIIVCNNDNCYINEFLKKTIKNFTLKSTICPSIDISIPSNFKRLINNFKNFKIFNKFLLSNVIYNKYIIYSIEYFYLTYKKLYDPHTVVSYTSLLSSKNNFSVVVSTAYPIKFFISIKKIIYNLKINYNFKYLYKIKENYKIFNQNYKILLHFIKKNL